MKIKITSSHDDNHDDASFASPMLSNATLETYSVECKSIERDGDDYDDDDDDIDDDGHPQHHQQST